MKVTPPVWWDALPAPLPVAPAGAAHRADVAIIGAGFTGLSTALHLLRRRPGMRVMVLEADRVGAGASGRTTGMLGPGVGQSLRALVTRFGEERAAALYRATLRAVEDAARLVAAEAIDCDLEMSGQLAIARSGAGRARLRELLALHHRLGLPGDALDDAALSQRIRLASAAADESRGPAAMLLPIAGTLHPGKLLAGLVARVGALGGVLFEKARVLSIEGATRATAATTGGGAGGNGESAARPVRLRLAGGGEVVVDDVVVATAGYTAGLGLFRGRLLPVHLQVVVTDPLDDAARAAIGWGGREGVVEARRVFNYFRLTADNRIVFGGGAPRYQWSGGGAGNGHDVGEGAALERLARELGRTFPAEARLRASGGWTGIIGYVLDTLPAIERVPSNPAILHAVGWCGHGVALSLAAGGWLTHMLCDGAVPEDLPWYRTRLPLVPLEPARWLGFQMAVGWMSLMDRLE